ncbi:RNA polymerase sigma factor [Paenibacillus lutimineralis]|uniref:RNA polymerase sigma factor n=1 Tax=Paenibacillus lutimineralis TaxID=2707005 RepID=UPI001D0489BB|nr:sigma factor [Paenibacillus lutimineralis]
MLRYSNALLSVAYSILGDFHESQDVTQEAFVKCYNSLHTLKDPTRLGSWLYSIAYRTSLDFVKKKKPSFIYHFHLRINNHGNLLLESGHELYLLECHHFNYITGRLRSLTPSMVRKMHPREVLKLTLD